MLQCKAWEIENGDAEDSIRLAHNSEQERKREEAFGKSAEAHWKGHEKIGGASEKR